MSSSALTSPPSMPLLDIDLLILCQRRKKQHHIWWCCRIRSTTRITLLGTFQQNKHLGTTGLWSQVQNRPASVLVFSDRLSLTLFVLLWLNQFLISQLSWVIQKCDDPQHFPCLLLQAGSFQRAWERRQRHLFRSVKKFKFSSKRLLESPRPTAEQTTLYQHDGYKGAVINWPFF